MTRSKVSCKDSRVSLGPIFQEPEYQKTSFHKSSTVPGARDACLLTTRQACIPVFLTTSHPPSSPPPITLPTRVHIKDLETKRDQLMVFQHELIFITPKLQPDREDLSMVHLRVV